MSPAMQNGRATEVTPPVAAVEPARVLPTAYTEDTRLTALRLADDDAYSESYVVIEVAGDVGGSTARADDARWAASWVSYLASDERAALFPTRHVTRRCPECGCGDGQHTSPMCPGWED